MPRKPKPAAAVPPSVTLTVSDASFGGVATVTAPGGHFVVYSIQAAEGGQGGTISLDADGNGEITCGPTPTWSSGGGSGSAQVIEYPDPNDRSVTIGVSNVATFTVTP